MRKKLQKYTREIINFTKTTKQFLAHVKNHIMIS